MMFTLCLTLALNSRQDVGEPSELKMGPAPTGGYQSIPLFNLRGDAAAYFQSAKSDNKKREVVVIRAAAAGAEGKVERYGPFEGVIGVEFAADDTTVRYYTLDGETWSAYEGGKKLSSIPGVKSRQAIAMLLDGPPPCYFVKDPGPGGSRLILGDTVVESTKGYTRVVDPAERVPPAVYAETKDKNWVIVENGKLRRLENVVEVAPHGLGLMQRLTTKPAIRFKDKTGEWIEWGGTRGERYDAISRLRASVDGSQLSYVGLKGKDSFVWANGKKFGPYEGVEEIKLSDAGDKAAVVAKKGEKWFVAAGTKKGEEFSGIWGLTMSGDGSQVAYGAASGGKKYLVVGGHKTTVDENVTDIAMSSDGKKVIYAFSRDKQVVVMDPDNKAWELGPGSGHVWISQDGQRWAWWGGGGGYSKLWLGQEVMDCQFLTAFQEYQYLEVRLLNPPADGNGAFVVCDGRRSESFAQTERHGFLKDGRSVCIGKRAAGSASVSYLMVGEKSFGPYDEIKSLGSNGAIEPIYEARSNARWAVGVGETMSEGWDGVGSVVVGPGGKRFAHYGTRNQAGFLVSGKKERPVPSGPLTCRVSADGLSAEFGFIEAGFVWLRRVPFEP